MADSDLSGIDRVFDFIDSGVEKIDRVLNRTKYTEDQHQARRRGARRAEIDTAPAVKVHKEAAPAAASQTTAIATRRFRIVEAQDASTGKVIFVVTNGAAARAECSTRELAEKILRALETAP